MPYQITGSVIAPISVTCDTCEVARQCQFHLKRNGGFKGPGQRARTVGYLLVTDAADGHKPKRDFMGCVDFVNTLLPRQRLGRARREEGKDGEMISIIGQEGDLIEMTSEMAYNSRGQIIKPMAEYVECLRESGHDVNVDDNSLPVNYRRVRWKQRIPKYGESVGGSDYRDSIYAEAAQLQQAENDALEETLAPFAGGTDESEEPAVVVKRGPGRPVTKKVSDEAGA